MMLPMLVECALRSALLVAVVWLASRMLRLGNPQLERSAWLAVLASSLAMPLLMKLPELPAANAPAIAWLQHLDLGALPLARPEVEWQAIVLWIVIAGATVLIIRQTVGVVRWWHVRTLAKPISPSPWLSSWAGLDVRVTDEVTSPATVFSTVLVPEDFGTWPLQAQRAAMAHERAHVENRDFYVQWLAQLHRCVFWFNPLAWWLARRLSILSEHISDDAAIKEAAERASYAEMLLGLAQRAVRSDRAVAMVGRTALASRIERILADEKSPPAGRAKTLLLVGVLLPIIGIVATIEAVTARTPNQPGQSSNGTLNGGSADGAVSPATAARVVLPKSNPSRPLSIPVYPPVSRRSGEHGTVVLSLQVLEDGSVANATIHESSGYPNLDHAAMAESYRWQLDAGTVDGTPSNMRGRFAVTFKLSI